MSANPERMRPTPLSGSIIVQEANNIVGLEVARLLNECKKKNLPEQIRVIQLFLANKTGEPKEKK